MEHAAQAAGPPHEAMKAFSMADFHFVAPAPNSSPDKQKGLNKFGVNEWMWGW